LSKSQKDNSSTFINIDNSQVAAIYSLSLNSDSFNKTKRLFTR
jgi:hypothetical protein